MSSSVASIFRGPIMQQCECKPEINFSMEFPDHKIIDPNTHEYQFGAFLYACVMLLNYFCLTTFIMVKLMLLTPNKPNTSLDVDESKKVKEVILQKFREREKRVNAAFEIQSRQKFKQQMINHLKSMQTLPAFGEVYELDVAALPALPVSPIEKSSEGEETEKRASVTSSGEGTQGNTQNMHSIVEEDDEEIWQKEYEREWREECSRRLERRMGISSYETEGDDEWFTEYFL